MGPPKHLAASGGPLEWIESPVVRGLWQAVASLPGCTPREYSPPALLILETDKTEKGNMLRDREQYRKPDKNLPL